jgi:hypothetical protein
VQVPEQVVIDGGPHPNQAFAVIDQQPEVELDPRQLRDREPIDALPERGAGDRDRVDAVGLAAIAAAAALAGHQPGRDPHDALAADHEEPFEAARDVAAILDRPPARHPSREPTPALHRSRDRRPR